MGQLDLRDVRPMPPKPGCAAAGIHRRRGLKRTSSFPCFFGNIERAGTKRGVAREICFDGQHRMNAGDICVRCCMQGSWPLASGSLFGLPPSLM